MLILWQRITREIRVCSKIAYKNAHENILPFLGFIKVKHDQPAIVTPWVNAGNMKVFMKNNIELDVHSIVRDDFADMLIG